ncbi:hypothetical protein SEA_APIARY_63 [Rhodococcus phage Apiary]|nr:hypothetical protein SEA_BRAXOADDIE_63 [Rhodococcus phage Braxoaddie]WNM64986.1 hypothetical protein SEA_MASELOP_63 [Rhodococcus phage Maselop]WNM69871.1 hypothetical protein SEA_APIARY_63 [Rhodococcus phage Apiary]
MPKLQLGLGSDAAKVEAVEGFTTYDGPTPPPGIYPASVISMKMGESSSKKPMFTVYVKVDAPKNDPKGRDKYNGYLISHFLVVPGSRDEEHYGLQVGQINRLMDAMSGDTSARKALWAGQAVTDEKGEKILKIGNNVTLKGGVKVMIATKADSYKRKDKETGEVETVKTLRINDFYPMPDGGEPVAEEKEPEVVYEDEDESGDDSAPAADDDAGDEDLGVVADDDDAGEPDADDEPEPEDAGDDAADEGEPESADDYPVAAEEVADDEPEADEEEAPAPKRKRRSAF